MAGRVNEESFPVNVLVRRPDGSTESVRVGTAVRNDDGFTLSMGELTIGSVADRAPARRAASAGAGGAPAGGDGMVFPPYGRSKGAPVAGASLNDLEFYRNGCLRTLADEGKARWHDKERVLLAAIEAEIARQGGGGSRGESGGGRRSAPPSYDFEAPPAYSDDDIPF